MCRARLQKGVAVSGASTSTGPGFSISQAGKLSLVSGSTIVVNNTAQLRVDTNEFASANFGIDLNRARNYNLRRRRRRIRQCDFGHRRTASDRRHAANYRQEQHLFRRHCGRDRFDPRHHHQQPPANNENITDAGGLIVFDQNYVGTFAGVISDGQEMGTGPMLSGSLDKDDSTTAATAATSPFRPFRITPAQPTSKPAH